MGNPLGRDDKTVHADSDNQTEANRLDSLARRHDLATSTGRSKRYGEPNEADRNGLNPLLYDKFRGS